MLQSIFVFLLAPRDGSRSFSRGGGDCKYEKRRQKSLSLENGGVKFGNVPRGGGGCNPLNPPPGSASGSS